MILGRMVWVFEGYGGFLMVWFAILEDSWGNFEDFSEFFRIFLAIVEDFWRFWGNYLARIVGVFGSFHRFNVGFRGFSLVWFAILKDPWVFLRIFREYFEVLVGF